MAKNKRPEAVVRWASRGTGAFGGLLHVWEEERVFCTGDWLADGERDGCMCFNLQKYTALFGDTNLPDPGECVKLEIRRAE